MTKTASRSPKPSSTTAAPRAPSAAGANRAAPPPTALHARSQFAARGAGTEARTLPAVNGAPHPVGAAAKAAPQVTIGAAGKTGAGSATNETLEQCVFRSLDEYFSNLNGAKPHALREMVLGAIERPLLRFALDRCEGNQSAAADLLGINRNTLRRKIQEHGLADGQP